jgi:hypothetical protein
MKRAIAIVLVACGGKLGGDDSLADGSTSGADARTTDGPTASDAPIIVVDARSTCSKATTQIGLGGMGDCKFDLRWTCGTVSYEVVGGCSVTGGLNGGCTTSTSPTTKMVQAPMCSCSSPDGLVAQGAMLCGFPPPG